MKLLIKCLLFFWCAIVFAQHPERVYESYEIKDQYLQINVSDGIYQLSQFNDHILNIEFIPTIDQVSKSSHAIQHEPSSFNPEVLEINNLIQFKAKAITVKLQKSPFKISYYYKDNYKTSEKHGYTSHEDHFKIQLNLTETEVLFGGGSRALGMNRRGHKLQLYNRAHYGYQTKSELMNFTMPLVISSQQYLVHFDNPNTGVLDLDSQHNNTLSYTTKNGAKRYQLVFGDTWEDLIKQYTYLTGRQYIPPRWAFGNFSSRFGYHSQEEVLQTIEAFRSKNIPVDAVIIDLYWFGKTIRETMGNLSFDTDSFPKPKKMIKKLKRQGVETVLITEPFILSTSKRWEEAVKNDILAKDSLNQPAQYEFYFGNTGLIDVFKPEAKEWFWSIYKDLSNLGVNGIWGDLGEPEVHPDYLKHHNAKAYEVHNIYGHQWAKLIYENYRTDFPDQRPFILMRAGYSGSQKYGMIPWSGDVSRSWGGLASQPEIALQMGLQGMAYMHSDLGGFAGNLLDDRLYVRWLQYGVFQPIFRPHAQEDVASEPVFRSSFAQEHAKTAIELRYKLLPYNYQLAFENSQTGMPLMRPLFFEEPNNFRLYSKANTYLWGKDFLISPVLDELATSQFIYFPKTSNWIDFYSNRVYKAGTTAEVKLTQDHIPSFVRAGSFIVTAPVVQTTKDYQFNNLDVQLYYDPDVKAFSRLFYNDDGELMQAYSKEAYEQLQLDFKKETNSQFMVRLNHKIGQNFSSKFKTFNFHINGLNKAPQSVLINGKKVRFTYYKTQRKLSINTIQFQNKQIKITINKS